MAVFIIDRYYLTISFLITLGWQFIGYCIAYGFQIDKITDLWGAVNFFALALITLLCGQTFYARNIVASIFMMIWSARLGSFLLFRVLKTGTDGRFDDMRKHPLKLGGFWAFQVLWVFVVSLPVVILNSPAVSNRNPARSNPRFGTARDIVGIIFFVIGFLIEAIADQQKYLAKANKEQAKNEPCKKGIWSWSRHPPYFGEILLHWGIWILCLSPATNGTPSQPLYAIQAQYGAIFAPLLTMALLMGLSGLPIAEKSSGKKFYLMSYGKKAQDSNDSEGTWRNYKKFLDRTSILVPIPPAIYKPLPKFIKSTILFDFPFYKFDERKDGQKAVEEERNDDA